MDTMPLLGCSPWLKAPLFPLFSSTCYSEALDCFAGSIVRAHAKRDRRKARSMQTFQYELMLVSKIKVPCAQRSSIKESTCTHTLFLCFLFSSSLPDPISHIHIQ